MLNGSLMRNYFSKLIFLSMVVAVFLYSKNFFYKTDLLPVVVSILLISVVFDQIGKKLLLISLNIVLHFTDYSVADYASFFAIGRHLDVVCLNFSFWLGNAAAIYVQQKIGFKKTVMVSYFVIYLLIVGYAFHSKNSTFQMLYLFNLPYFYCVCRMMFLQTKGESFSSADIFMNLNTLFNVQGIPIPLLLSDYCKPDRVVTNKVRKLVVAFLGLFLFRFFVLTVFSIKNDDFYAYLQNTLLPYSEKAPSFGFYPFEELSKLSLFGFLLAAHAFFFLNIFFVVLWKKTLLLFFDIEIPNQINFQWNKSKFYEFFQNFVYHDNKVFVGIFIEPISSFTKKYFVSKRYSITAISLFFGLSVHHFVVNPFGILKYQSNIFIDSYSSLVLYAAVASFLVYMSLKYEKISAKNNKILILIKYGGWFIIFALLGFIARDHFFVSLSTKFQFIH